MTGKRETTRRTGPGPVGSAHIVATGSFGQQAAPVLRSALREDGYALTATAAGLIRDAAAARVVVLLADHDDPVLARDMAAWQAADVPFLVVAQQHPDIRVGPLDVPGTALCATCFGTRQRQHGSHAGAPDPDTSGWEWATSVDGFPPFLVALVVGLVRRRLAQLRPSVVGPTNEVTVVNTMTLAVRTAPVVPVNLCPRCSGQKPLGVLGGYAPMFPDLTRVPR